MISGGITITLLLGLTGTVLSGTERFDLKVRNDFFAGFAGDRNALQRGMRECEAILKTNPNHAQAKVWHGGGLLFESGLSFAQGDRQTGVRLFDMGVKEMDEAVGLEPESLAVRIPRGSAYLAATAAMPEKIGRPLLERGVQDFEKAYDIQRPYLEKLSNHARGELLMGLADGHRRLGNTERARHFFEQVARMGAASGHQAQAEEYLKTGTLAGRVRCSGCHVE